MKVILNCTLIALLLCWGSSSTTAQDHSDTKVTIVNNYSKDYNYNYNYDYNYNYNYSYKHSNYQYNKPSYAKLGVYLEKDETGVFVKNVSDQSAADAAGMQAGDRIIAFDKVKVWGERQLIALIKHNNGGETVQVDYQRNGQILQTMVTLDKVVNRNYRSFEDYDNPCERLEVIYGRPFLGVYLDRSKDSEVSGARITSIIKNTGAAASSLQAEDRIIGLDGVTIKNSKDVHNHIQGTKKPTEPMQIEVLREGKKVTLTAIVGSWADRKDMQRLLDKYEQTCEEVTDPATACNKLQQMEGSPFLGIYMTNVGEEQGGGALITSVIEGTQAAQTTLRGGDKIVKFNGEVVTSHPDASRMILNTKPNAPVQLEVLRGDKIIQVEGIMGSLTSRPSNRAKAAVLAEACTLQEGEEPVAPKEKTTPTLDLTTATNLSLFPNPSNDYVNVVYEGQEGALVVSIVTLDGKSLYDKKVPEFKGVYNDQIDLNNFPAGIYVVYITQGDRRTSKQLIIE